MKGSQVSTDSDFTWTMSKSYLPIPKRCRLSFFISRELFLISSCLLGQPRENRGGGEGEESSPFSRRRLNPVAADYSRYFFPIIVTYFSFFYFDRFFFAITCFLFFFIVYSFIRLHVFLLLPLFHYTLSSLLMKSIMSFNSKSLVSYVVVLVLFY